MTTRSDKKAYTGFFRKVRQTNSADAAERNERVTYSFLKQRY